MVTQTLKSDPRRQASNTIRDMNFKCHGFSLSLLYRETKTPACLLSTPLCVSARMTTFRTLASNSCPI